MDSNHYQGSHLYAMRHSAAHVMAEAVQEIFPDAKFAIGPAIDDGFYYDFELPRALTPDDLPENPVSRPAPEAVRLDLGRHIEALTRIVDALQRQRGRITAEAVDFYKRRN